MTGPPYVGLLACLVGIAVVVSAVGASIEDPRESSNATPTTAREKESSTEVPDDMRLEPSWRERSDCGPLALFVLMQLQGKQVTLDDVKRVIHLDPEQGCSLKDIQAAAEQMGMATEARFVQPRDLSHVPGPFIVHGRWSIEKNRGHFYLILGYDSEEKKYATIDTTLAKLGWLPEDTVLCGYSGYILVPEDPASRRWDRWTGCGLLLVGAAVFSLCSYGMFRRRRRVGT